MNEKSSLPVGTETHVSFSTNWSAGVRSLVANLGYESGSAR